MHAAIETSTNIVMIKHCMRDELVIYFVIREDFMKVELQHITKTFYGSKALDDVQLMLNSGEINCLVGENGAGKSTIIKVLAGFHEPDSGEIIIDGTSVIFKNPRDSQKNKIAVIHQELMLVPELSVAENIFLGDWPLAKTRLVNRKIMNKKATELLARLGAKIQPTQLVSSLSTGEQQLVEIVKALSKKVELLVLDEPTASLSEVDANHLLNIIKNLRDHNIAILYVSHRLEEVFSIADKITVFRDGKYVGSKNNADVTKDEIVKMMVGHAVLNEQFHHAEHNFGKVALVVKNLTCERVFSNINFELHEGEVLGIAGLVGAGRSEILRAIYGTDHYDSGEIFIYGQNKKFHHPLKAIQNGISLVPEDRKMQGLVLGQSVKNNIVLGNLKRVSRAGFVIEKSVNEISKLFCQKLSIKMESINALVNTLSGGNQQKVVLARSLVMNPKILMLDEPTRGVDIGAREEIHKLIDAAVNQNLAVLVVSSDISELLDISDRVVVLRKGRIIDEYSSDEISKEEVIRLATA